MYSGYNEWKQVQQRAQPKNIHLVHVREKKKTGHKALLLVLLFYS